MNGNYNNCIAHTTTTATATDDDEFDRDSELPYNFITIDTFTCVL